MQTRFFAHMTYRNLLDTIVIALALLLATLLLSESLTPRPAQAAPPAQGPIVVNAVDNDPDNNLWNCETNRVPFGNNETDRSRCFSFRYQVPREGIKSATVHISLSTLGADQDTDATIVAVGKPYAPCAWGQGKMPGCVGLHGGFQGTHKSLNLNLLDIACDRSVQASPEAQRLVLDQLQTGTLHMLLQDDTAMYSAQLVLNGGTPSFQCGASTSDSPPTTQSPAAAGTPPSLANVTPQQILTELNKALTGTSSPHPPDRTGATVATAIGAVLFSLLALSNYLLSDPSLVQRFFRTATSQPPTGAPSPVTTFAKPTSAPKPSSQMPPASTTLPEQLSASGAAGSTSAGAPSADVSVQPSLSFRAEREISLLPDGDFSSQKTLVEMTPEQLPPDFAAAGVSVSGQPPVGDIAGGAISESKIGFSTAGELLGAPGAEAQEKAIESIADVRETAADLLLSQVGETEKRRRLEEERKRLKALVAEKTRVYEEAGNALKRVIDSSGDFDAARRAWQQAGTELQEAQHNLQQFTEEFPEKPQK